MTPLTRRTFVQLTAGTALAAASERLLASPETPAISNQGGVVRVNAPNYTWEYTEATDTFLLRDASRRVMVSGTLQPAVVVAPAGQPSQRQCSPGKAMTPRIQPGRISIEYEQANTAARIRIAWRFDTFGIWMEPVEYESTVAEDVVSLRYFCQASGADSKPLLHSTYLVVPGISEGSALSPILRDYVHLDQSVWLGRGSFAPGLTQQWGLPVHYFCGFNVDSSAGLKNMLTTGQSDAFALGLADLPSGDLFLDLYEGNCSPRVDYRSDLWKHVRTPGKLTLGATFLWATGPGYREAIANYYNGLLQAGVIQVHQNSPAKAQVALTPEFCTWGSQVDENKAQDHLDEAFLNETYLALKRSGMKAGLFSIDDKWEGAYGNLEHSSTRLPHFEEFLNQLRKDGYKIGLWAALMRCERPADIGLTEDHVLKTPRG